MSFLVLYVADIFEWELGNITICVTYGDVGINEISEFYKMKFKHVLNIKIYRDRSTRLITLSRNTFLD